MERAFVSNLRDNGSHDDRLLLAWDVRYFDNENNMTDFSISIDVPIGATPARINKALVATVVADAGSGNISQTLSEENVFFLAVDRG